MTRPAVLLAALALLLSGMGLAACGGGEDTVPAATIVEAAQRTNDAGAARFTLDGNISAAGQDLGFTASGVIDGKAQKGRMEIDFSSLADQVPGGSPEDFKGEQLIDGFVIYMRIPFINESLGASTPWVKLDLEEANRMQGIDLSQFQTAQNDPAQMLQYLRAVAGEITDEGSEDVNGVETTRYKATVDLRKVPDGVPPERREAARESVENLIEQVGKSEVPIEVWIDEDGLVRRQRMEISIKPAGTDQEVKSDFTIDFLEFGVPAPDLTPPPASEVTDLAEVAGGLGSP